MNLQWFLQQLFNGLSTGSIYALIALGYTMVYGTIRLINFAHGDILMMGAFFGFYLVNVQGMDFYLSLALTLRHQPSRPEFGSDSYPVDLSGSDGSSMA